MSSLVRRIQKKIAKSQGYRRSQEGPTIGKIVNNTTDEVLLRWPQVKAPTKKAED